MGFALELFIWGGTVISWSVPLLLGTVAVGLVAAACAWWRPIGGFVVATGIAALINLSVPGWESFVGVLLALFILARSRPAVESRMGLALAAVPLLINAWNSAGWTGQVTFASFTPIAVLWLAAAVAVWTVGHAFMRSARQVTALHASLEETYRAAQDAERRSIARDLHDIVAHSVAGILLQAGGARALGATEQPMPGSTAERVQTALGHIEDSSHQALRELHRLLRAMRAVDEASDDDGERLGSLAEIDAVLGPARAGGLTVTVTETGRRPDLDRSVDLAAYRCLQEAVANAMKHAGAGSTIHISITWGEKLTLDMLSTPTPRTQRASRTPIPGGLGLIGLAERLASVGGTLDAGPGEAGFRTLVRIPITASGKE